MRISDWSSDVCSSDLPAGSLRVVAILGDEAGGRDEDGIVAGDGRAAEGGCTEQVQADFLGEDRRRTVLRRPREAQKESRARGWKIGRAPCRERGCQYV